MAQTFLFAYGLLLKGMRYHDSHLSGHGEFVSHAKAEGRLVYLSGPDIPAMLAGEGDVTGELYRIDDSHLPVLDYLFGVVDGRPEKSEYVRRLVDVETVADGDCMAWAYFMRSATQRTRYPDAALIEDGDWRRLNAELEPQRREKSQIDPEGE
jgi:gamma-glutamylcyclotransferase (GGCT)/AIG2-like uncharacterized protein YtfP